MLPDAVKFLAIIRITKYRRINSISACPTAFSGSAGKFTIAAHLFTMYALPISKYISHFIQQKECIVENKRSLPILMLVVIGIIIITVLWMKGAYNGMVVQDENVKTAWSQVENQYQRRADLITNLVNTVKGYAQHERGTLEAVIEARAKATETNINVGNLTEENLKAFQSAQAGLSSALSRLMVVMEQYPDLKANDNFRDLQAQLEGTENRISVERKRFNETAQQYNTHIRSFPTTILAGLFGFQQRPYFAAESGADKAPVVDFTGKSK